MPRVTRNVAAEAVDDLLAQPPNVSLAFNAGAAVVAMPVAFRRSGGRYWVGLPNGRAQQLPGPGATVTLLIDDGWYWFELRAIKLGGRLVPAPQPPPGASSELDWLELVADKVVAWDYNSLREVPPDVAH